LGNMQLNYDKANETNVANNWDSMFDNWKAYKRNDQYSNAMGETADGQFGQTYFT